MCIHMRVKELIGDTDLGGDDLRIQLEAKLIRKKQSKTGTHKGMLYIIVL